MAKAVADAHGLQYRGHDEILRVFYLAEDLSDDARVSNVWHVANELHGFFYVRKRFLYLGLIGEDLDHVEVLLDILEPLTEP